MSQKLVENSLRLVFQNSQFTETFHALFNRFWEWKWKWKNGSGSNREWEGGNLDLTCLSGISFHSVAVSELRSPHLRPNQSDGLIRATEEDFPSGCCRRSSPSFFHRVALMLPCRVCGVGGAVAVGVSGQAGVAAGFRADVFLFYDNGRDRMYCMFRWNHRILNFLDK